MWLSVLLAMLALTSGDVMAHGGEHHGPSAEGSAAGPWWTRWTFDLAIIVTLSVVTAVYATGIIRLWRSAGIGRGVRGLQAAAFAAGMLAIVAALLSPIDALSDELSWMHMIQHMLLMMVGAPLVVLGGSMIAALWALPARWRRRGAEWLGKMRRWRGWQTSRYLLWQPLLAFALFALALWVWHVPALYEAALHNDLVHDLQHLMFFTVSCLFWRVLVDPLSRLRMSPGLGVLYLFATSMHATFLGVFMALSPSPWYDFYETTTAAWNLSALEDQQVAGLIMWMPMCMIYAVAAAIIFGLWLREDAPVGEPAGGAGASAEGGANPEPRMIHLFKHDL